MSERLLLALTPVLLLSCGDDTSTIEGREAGATDGAAGADMLPSAGPCVDDQLGNASQARSRELMGSVNLPGLKLCPGTEDWFRLDAREVASFGARACRPSSAGSVEFAAYREEFGQLYRHMNCGSSGGDLACVGTCAIEAPGIYYFRVSAAQEVPYNFELAYTPPSGKVTQSPPGFDTTPVLQPEMPRELTVCTPFAQYYQLKIDEPSTVTIESTMEYSGYYLDFTLTAENEQHISYWPQGPGITRHEMPLDPGRYMLRIRSAYSACRMFTLDHKRVAR